MAQKPRASPLPEGQVSGSVVQKPAGKACIFLQVSGIDEDVFVAKSALEEYRPGLYDLINVEDSLEGFLEEHERGIRMTEIISFISQ